MLFAGVEAFEKFMGSTMRWFKEEQKLFARNSDLIRKALERAESDGEQGDYQSRYYQAIDEIYQLELELKKAIARHSELLGACTALQKKVGELVTKSKFAALKRSLDFKRMSQRLMERDRADLLEALVMPLFDIHAGKTLNMGRLEDLLMVSPEKSETVEAISEGEEQAYIYEDEIEDARIQKNYILLFENLLKTLENKGAVTLAQWQEQLSCQLGEAIVRNADYYSFLVHLAQKKEYEIKKMAEKPDTFLEEAVKVFLEEHKEYETMVMTLTMLPEEELLLGSKMSVTNLRIERRE